MLPYSVRLDLFLVRKVHTTSNPPCSLRTSILVCGKELVDWVSSPNLGKLTQGALIPETEQREMRHTPSRFAEGSFYLKRLPKFSQKMILSGAKFYEHAEMGWRLKSWSVPTSLGRHELSLSHLHLHSGVFCKPSPTSSQKETSCADQK